MWQCRDCGLLLCADRSGRVCGSGHPVDEGFTRLAFGGKRYIDSAAEFISSYQPLLARLEEWRPPGRLLDVGCGPGFLLEAARGRGWEVLGLDPSRFAAEHVARTFGLPVVCSTLAEAALEAASFDAVTLIHSLEHLPDPVAALTEAARLLRPGGVVFVETPNSACDDHALFGREWPLLNPKEHICIFDPPTLARAMGLAGLRVLQLSAPVHDPLHGGVLQAWAERPKRAPVTRLEALTRMAAALAVPAPMTSEATPYRDLPGGEDAERIGALWAAGVLPWSGPWLEPARLVTRGEVAVLLVVALGLEPPFVARAPGEGPPPAPAPPFFVDVPGPEGPEPAHPTWRHIHLLRQAGLTTGFDSGTFRPNEPIRSADLDTLLERARRWREERRAPPSGAK